MNSRLFAEPEQFFEKKVPHVIFARKWADFGLVYH